jgi:sulfur-carrier protein
MAAVILPRSLATLVPGVEHRTTVEAATVGELIAVLDARWPGIADRLCDAGPSIREHINVFVDGERTTSLTEPIGPDATVHVIPAIAGGAGLVHRRRDIVSRDDLDPFRAGG